jgi:hypothetical protein
MVVEYISIYAIRFHWYRRILLSNIYNMIEHKFYNLLRLSFHHDWNFQSNSNQWCILDTTDVVLILLKVVLSTNNSSPLIHKCQILTVFCSKKLIDYTYDKKNTTNGWKTSSSRSLQNFNSLTQFEFFLYTILVSQEVFEDTKGVIRIRISKNRQHNGQKKKYKRTNNDLQIIHIKIKIE